MVLFRFNFLELEAQSRCQFDYVAAFEGETLNRTHELGRYCGNQTVTPPILKSIGNILTVQFKTDHSVTARG
jgi:hypothetical protein